MIFYGLIIIAVIMFGANFALQDVYRRMRGSGLRISLESSFVGSCAGVIVLLIIHLVQNGFHFEISLTPFTLLMALLSALNGFAFTFCSFRALDVINLSLFSLFSMLGGMALPFLQGIIFYGEELTWAKGVCFALICVALLMTVSRSSEKKKKGTIYYIGIFMLNGMAGVLTTFHEKSAFPHADPSSYSIWIAVCTLAVSGIFWLILFSKKKGEKPYTLKAGAVSALHGSVGRIANLLLVIALANGVHASAQYPLVTGGVMIVSTLICFFGDRKPSKREIASIVVAFAGTLALFFIPV